MIMDKFMHEKEPKSQDIIVCGHDLNNNQIFGHDYTHAIKFSDENMLKKYFQQDLFSIHKGHYIRSGPSRFPRIIVCEWQGKAYCDLIIDKGFIACDDEQSSSGAQTKIQELQVNAVEWYEQPVPLSKKGIKNPQHEPVITKTVFSKIKSDAGNIQIFK